MNISETVLSSRAKNALIFVCYVDLNSIFEIRSILCFVSFHCRFGHEKSFYNIPEAKNDNILIIVCNSA